MSLLLIARELVLLAILRGMLAMLRLVGRKFELSEPEREALLARMKAALDSQ